jgi:hypothetical protein
MALPGTVGRNGPQCDREGVGMARRATYGNESGRSVVGQTFSLQTGFSRSLRRALRALKPHAE